MLAVEVAAVGDLQVAPSHDLLAARALVSIRVLEFFRYQREQLLEVRGDGVQSVEALHNVHDGGQILLLDVQTVMRLLSLLLIRICLFRGEIAAIPLAFRGFVDTVRGSHSSHDVLEFRDELFEQSHLVSVI